MLIGYNPKNGYIEFLFSDSDYLNRMFPKNSARIINFWKIKNHGLIEMFIDAKDFSDYMNYWMYKISNGEIVKKEPEEIKEIIQQKKPKIIKQVNDENFSGILNRGAIIKKE